MPLRGAGSSAESAWARCSAASTRVARDTCCAHANVLRRCVCQHHPWHHPHAKKQRLPSPEKKLPSPQTSRAIKMAESQTQRGTAPQIC